MLIDYLEVLVSMQRNAIIGILAATITAAVLTASIGFSADLTSKVAVAQQEPPPTPIPITSPELLISETVELGGAKLKTGEVLILGVVSPEHGMGPMKLMIAANLPCADGKADNVAGNDAPALMIVGMTDAPNNPNNVMIPLITDATSDTGLMGADGMCVFHFDAGEIPGEPCAIVAINEGDNVKLPQGAMASWAGIIMPPV